MIYKTSNKNSNRNHDLQNNSNLSTDETKSTKLTDITNEENIKTINSSNVKNQDFPELIKDNFSGKVNELKNQGNQLYTDSKYEEAITKYKESIS